MATVALQSGVTAPAVLFPHMAEIYPLQVDPSTSPTILAGTPVYQEATGYVAPTSSLTGGSITRQAKGITLETGGPRQAVSVLRRGHVGGYNLASYSPGQKIYAGDTAGSIVDTPGTTTVLIGSVVALSDAEAGNAGTLASTSTAAPAGRRTTEPPAGDAARGHRTRTERIPGATSRPGRPPHRTA